MALILADTSIWIYHWRYGVPAFADMLNDGLILMHPIILGELSCGNLSKRARTLQDLRSLPFSVEASHDEVLTLLERHKLFGKGIGFSDAHLIASAILTNCQLLTDDGRMAAAATTAGAKLSNVPTTH